MKIVIDLPEEWEGYTNRHLRKLIAEGTPLKMGKWIKEEPPMVERCPFCSECGFVNPFDRALNYCPRCGAEMKGDKDEQCTDNRRSRRR